MIKSISNNPEELELKYIVNKDISNQELLDLLIKKFIENGYKMISKNSLENSDDYYDTINKDVYNQKGSLRIRKITSSEKIKYKGTYKMPLATNEIFAKRTEIEFPLISGKYKSLIVTMQNKNISFDFSSIIPNPIINSTYQRIEIVFEKDGVQVCLSLDNCLYKNYFLNETEAADRMVEIEIVGYTPNRTILNEINEFIKKSFPYLEINKQSKYERGINKTTLLNKEIMTRKLSKEANSK